MPYVVNCGWGIIYLWILFHLYGTNYFTCSIGDKSLCQIVMGFRPLWLAFDILGAKAGWKTQPKGAKTEIFGR